MNTWNDPRQLKRKIDAYEQQLEQPISPERRRAIQDAIRHCKEKLQKRRRLRGAFAR